MKIVKQVFEVVLISAILYSVIMIIPHTQKDDHPVYDNFIFSKGNAPDSTRSQIIEQLHIYQNGYIDQDPVQLKPYMQQLFSQENLLVLGTDPDEIKIGQAKVSKLVSNDWKGWGDFRLAMNNAHISTSENVAWISTVGSLKKRFSILPLRISAVMVREGLTWKFQYMQFQFDVDITYLSLTKLLLIIWLVVSLVSLTVLIVKSLRKRNRYA